MGAKLLLLDAAGTGSVDDGSRGTSNTEPGLEIGLDLLEEVLTNPFEVNDFVRMNGGPNGTWSLLIYAAKQEADRIFYKD